MGYNGIDLPKYSQELCGETQGICEKFIKKYLKVGFSNV